MRRLDKTRDSKFRKKSEPQSAGVVCQPPGYWNFSLAIPQLCGSLNCFGNQVLSRFTDQKIFLQKGIRWLSLALTSYGRVWPNLSLGVLSAWPELLHTLQCCWLCSSGEYQPLLAPWSWLQWPDSPCLHNIRLPWNLLNLSAWEVSVSALENSENKSIFCHCIKSSVWFWI